MFAGLTRDQAACGSIVAGNCERKYGLLLGSGTTALTLACRMTPLGRKKVIVPAIACAHVLFAIMYAECTPVFVDICPESGLIDPEMVRAALEIDPSIGAIVVVHTFGHIAELPKISVYAKACGALVIEDAAQAQGGVYANGRPVGSLGDLSLLSFGHTKILDLGSGGVLMTDRQDFFDTALALAQELPSSPVERVGRFEQYRSRYYSEWNARKSDSSALKRIGMLHQDFRDIFLNRTDDETARRIIQALPTLNSHVAARIQLADEYTSFLSKLNYIQLCNVKTGYTPWRYVFRVAAIERDGLLNHLRQARLDVSSWYPSLAHFWRQDPSQVTLPIAEAFAKEIVNLWVTPGYDKQQIQFACALIKGYFERNLGAGRRLMNVVEN